MLLGGRLARDDLENLFPSYVSGDEQCMRRAKWFPAGSSILAWMRHRDSAFQVGQPRGPSPDSHFRAALQRPTSSQTSLPTMPQGGSAATPSSTAACWSIAELKERPSGRATRRLPAC